MSEFNIPNTLIRLTWMTMENTQSQVRIQSDLSDLITTQKGLRQGDSLACLLFNLAFEKVVRNAGIQMSGTIFYKSVQLLAYADDIDIIARTRTALRWCNVRCQEVGGEKLRNAARNRDSWQKLLKKALAQKGLLCQ